LVYGLGDGGFESRQELKIFLFTTASKPALGPTQPPIQWTPGALSMGIKWPGSEADDTPPSSAEVKNAWNYTSIAPIRLHGVVLSLKYMNNFALYPTSTGDDILNGTEVLNFRFPLLRYNETLFHIP
jgi:hypothetical protein